MIGGLAAHRAKSAQIARRVPLHAYAELVRLNWPLARMTVVDDNPGDESGPGGSAPCAYNLVGISDSDCSFVSVYFGSVSCEPPYLVLPNSAPFFLGYVAYYSRLAEFGCGYVDSRISGTAANITTAGVWIGSGPTSREIEAFWETPGTVQLYQGGVPLATAAAAFVNGALLRLQVLADGITAKVFYNGAQLITQAIAAFSPGYVGIIGATKGHSQTLAITDCRCDPDAGM